MVVASCGLGVDSTAMLVGMVERGERVDLALFADTGGEHPHTYAFKDELSAYLVAHGMPAIVTVKAPNETLEQSVLKLQTLPSIVFGWKTCSQRFKIEPQEKYLRHWQPAKDAWARGEKITKLIGYDADEPQRAKNHDDDRFQNRYPLIEWDWGRTEALAAIERAGLSNPGKSACFFCPSSKKHEIIHLANTYPELAARAVAMEKNATRAHTAKGLGRSFSWTDLIAADEAQAKMFPETPIAKQCVCG